MIALSKKLFLSCIARLFKLLAAGRVCAREQSGSVREPERFARSKPQRFSPFHYKSPPSFASVYTTQNYAKNMRVGHADFARCFDMPEFFRKAHRVCVAYHKGFIGVYTEAHIYDCIENLIRVHLGRRG